MRQAIVTKFRGARVAARAEAGSITVPWAYELGVEGNHSAAAKALAAKLGWRGQWYGGGLPNAGYCFVLTADDCDSTVI